MTELTREQFRAYLKSLSTEELLALKTAIRDRDRGTDVKQVVKIGGKAVGMSVEMVGEFLKLFTGKKADWIYPLSRAAYDVALIGKE